MNLSNKIDEALGKPNTSEQPSTQSAPVEIKESSGGSMPKLSLNLEDLRDYLIVIVGFVVTAGAVFLLILPQFELIGQNNSQLSSSQAQLTELKRQADYLDNLVGLQEELEQNIELADQALPSTEDRVPYILDQLIQISEENGVVVETLSLSGITESAQSSVGANEQVVTSSGQASTGSDLRRVMIQMSVAGNTEAISNFMNNIAYARTLIDVVNFQLTTREDDSDEGVVGPQLTEVSMSLVSYLKSDSNTSAVDLSTLANSPNYDNVIERLRSMDYYEPGPVDIDFGRENPFDTLESTPSVEFNLTPEEETETIPENPDNIGFE